MRINFASAQDARFWRAFERARDELRERNHFDRFTPEPVAIG